MHALSTFVVEATRLSKCMHRSTYQQFTKTDTHSQKREPSSVPTSFTTRPCFPSSNEIKMEPTAERLCSNEIMGSPIGFIRSCFKSKNGTPRQPSVCAFSRARLKVLKEVFPNPEHSIHGLSEFSHVWILFIFHKNGGNFTKAKVKPPRLDGVKVGVFATRSPHRPNPIGLTLAKLDRIEGDTLHLSGVDIIDGTPVLDIKPYVPSYDKPDNIQEHRTSFDNMQSEHPLDTGNLMDPRNQGLEHGCSNGTTNSSSTPSSGKYFEEASNNNEALALLKHTSSYDKADSAISLCSDGIKNKCLDEVARRQSNLENDDCLVTADNKQLLHQMLNSPALSTEVNKTTQPSEESGIKKNTARKEMLAQTDEPKDEGCLVGSKVRVADWIECPPIKKLDVRFTENAKAELRAFNRGSSDRNYQLEFLNNVDEAEQAIRKILEADPRSTYRRNSCLDRLYFFTVDTLHVTCWFGHEFVEVVRIQPVCFAEIP